LLVRASPSVLDALALSSKRICVRPFCFSQGTGQCFSVSTKSLIIADVPGKMATLQIFWIILAAYPAWDSFAF
jgi:hypothetical protein